MAAIQVLNRWTKGWSKDFAMAKVRQSNAGGATGSSGRSSSNASSLVLAHFLGLSASSFFRCCALANCRINAKMRKDSSKTGKDFRRSRHQARKRGSMAIGRTAIGRVWEHGAMEP
mmetsp:Transcript_1746/g.3597  ORF Transcript_1746/g.3597 Transcript_1746/m.3597 type:complete len:116 (+) Transcript_1746:827-1174(+)